jgi:Tol biopolymer transport system component
MRFLSSGREPVNVRRLVPPTDGTAVVSILMRPPRLLAAVRFARTTLLVVLVAGGAWLITVGLASAAVPTHNGKIAFLRETANCGTSLGTDVYVMNSDGSSQKRLTTKGRACTPDRNAPVWSPNGRKIAFVRQIGCSISTSGGCNELFLMNADGSGQRQLTKNRAELYRYPPTWSPDGRKIAFVGNDLDKSGQKTGSCPCDIFVINADGSGLKKLAADSVDPVWSPDGKRIAFVANRHGGILLEGEIYVINADGTHQRSLSNDRAQDTLPVWSPDGKKILFTSASSSRPGKYGLYVMKANGSSRKRLEKIPVDHGLLSDGVWSPDGKKIVFQTFGYGIYVMNADGSGQTKLTKDEASSIPPAWSPNGKQIAFISSRNGKSEIYVMNTDGSGQKRLTANYKQDDALAWQPVR